MVAPKQNLEDDCILAAHTAAGLAAVRRQAVVDDRAARMFSRLLAQAASNFPRRTTRGDRRLLWAIGLVQPNQPAQQELPVLAFALSQKIDAGVKGELEPAALDAAKMTCLRMSDALGHPSKGLNFG